ncbi:MAG: enoyl-CoA hydratase/isomerase family protein [Chloroflexi bacterium]|nr:enoyl-CoA hydratase/isomerase family protein [Chloroflexota bacterium]
MYETILYEVNAGVGAITLNRVDVLNAMNDAMRAELQDALKAAERDPAVRCLVLTGAGRAFCSGQDLRDRANSSGTSLGDTLRQGYNPIIRRLRTIEKPVIASVNGVAAGAGCSLALACDLRIASERASFIEVFSRVGLVPDSGSCYLLPRLIGLGRALEMAFTGDPVDAQEAYRLGLVNRVVAPDALAAATRELAERLARGPTKALGMTKRAMNRSLGMDLDEALDYEAHLQEVAGQTEDFREGVQAFIEKRPAAFTGR